MIIEIYPDSQDEWRWRMRAKNGRIVASGGEGFSRKQSCERSIVRVIQAMSHAEPIRITETTK